jgi:hypothetical protein
MRIKMKKEMSSSERIDEAFKKIKTHTTVSDVQAMVRRFQQREQTYTAQLQAVSTSEQKVDSLKKANEELTKRLQELQIDAGKAGSETAASTDGGDAPSYNANDTEIIQMNNELSEINRSMQKLQERFKRIQIVNNQVQSWAKRVYNKFSTLTEDANFRRESGDLVNIFQTMNDLVDKEIAVLNKRQEEGGGDDGIDYAEVFTEFATEDFINKNIRVRPFSGVTHADETRDGRQSNISRGLGAAGESGADDVDQGFSVEADDHNKARLAVKRKKEEFDEQERRRKALEEKEKKK